MTIPPKPPEKLEALESPKAPDAPTAVKPTATKTTAAKPPKKKSKRKKLWLRITLFTLRLLLVPTLCLLALYAGLVIGYVRIGNQPYSDIFDMATWRHLYELIYSKT